MDLFVYVLVCVYSSMHTYAYMCLYGFITHLLLIGDTRAAPLHSLLCELEDDKRIQSARRHDSKFTFLEKLAFMTLDRNQLISVRKSESHKKNCLLGTNGDKYTHRRKQLSYDLLLFNQLH